MITQRLIHGPDGSVVMLVRADPESADEVVSLFAEIGERSTVTTEGPIHHMSGPVIHPRVE